MTDKAPDGRHVERLFVYGNHDWEGFKYGNAAKQIFGKDGGTDRKFVFASGFHRSAGTKEANSPTVLQVDAGLLQAKGALLIKAIPRNSFGVAGSSIAMEFSAK